MNNLIKEFKAVSLIDKIRALSGDGKKDLAAVLGISYFTLANKIGGRSPFSDDQIAEIEEYFAEKEL